MMKRRQRNSTMCFTYFATVGLFGLTSVLWADATRSFADLEDEIKDLCKHVLSNPIDATARRTLAGLRPPQRQRRHQGLDALARGLDSYVNHQPQPTILNLNKAKQSPYILDWANSILPTSVDDMLEKCKQYKKSTTRCRLCLGTYWSACKSCEGAGVRRCLQCRGLGATSASPRLGRPGHCGACEGLGCFECRECTGEGFVPCMRCTPKDGGIPANERKTIEDLMAMAIYLRDGGIDFFTQDALKCSPRLQPGEPTNTPSPRSETRDGIELK
jgi:hypothetical protein